MHNTYKQQNVKHYDSIFRFKPHLSLPCCCVLYSSRLKQKSCPLYLPHTNTKTHQNTKLFDVTMSSAVKQTDVNCFTHTPRLDVISHSGTRRPMTKWISRHGNKHPNDFPKIPRYRSLNRTHECMKFSKRLRKSQSIQMLHLNVIFCQFLEQILKTFNFFYLNSTVST